MSDEEDYDSDEDADYVPSEGELGSEEENSGDEEDLSVLADDAGTTCDKGSKKSQSKKSNKDTFALRKRRGGIKLEVGDHDAAAEGNGEEGEENKELAKQIKEEEEAKKAEKEKKRADDLWASFKSDVKPVGKPVPRVAQSVSPSPQASMTSSLSTEKPQLTTPVAAAGSAKTSEKITITKIFDFAGEEIKVTKEVDVNSKEAKAEMKKQQERQDCKNKEEAVFAGTNSPPSAAAPSPSIQGLKRPAPAVGGLGGVLSKIGKKQKMGTLEKSKMDWDSFKKKEGIDEDLKIHNKGKDGYIERMAFLSRTDMRQFEIERELRLSKSGKR